jgi:hypothetical protein
VKALCLVAHGLHLVAGCQVHPLRFILSGNTMVVCVISNFYTAMAQLVAHIAHIMTLKKPYCGISVSILIFKTVNFSPLPGIRGIKNPPDLSGPCRFHPMLL